MSESATANNKNQNFLETLVGYLKAIFSPILPAITAAGLLQGLIILLVLFNLLDESSSAYVILSSLNDVVFYFLPALIAVSASRVFETDTYISLALALVLFHPDILDLFASDGQTTFLGLPVYEADYSSSVFPAIFIVWAQKYIERFSKKIVPDIVQGIFAPLLTFLITGILGLMVLGPIGMGIGILLGNILKWIGENIATWLVPTLLGGLGIFAVMTGAHYTLMPIMFDQLGSQGYETFFAAGMLATNLALGGAVLGAFIKTRHTKSQFSQDALSAFFTAILGISQPGIYGVALKSKRVLIGAVLGGFVGGFIGGITNFVAYAYVNPGLAALPIYMSPDGSYANIIKAIVIIVVSFAVALVFVLLGDSDLEDEDSMADENATAEAA